MSTNDDLDRRAPPLDPAAPPPDVLVESDEARFRHRLARHGGRAWITPALIAINLAIFAIMIASGIPPLSPTAADVLPWGADYGPLTLGGEPWRILSNAFLHFGLLHVALNMYVLWQIGPLVERLFHRLGFAALYLISAIGGSLASLIVHPTTVSAGASGAVFGVYGAFLGYLLRQRGTIPASVLSRLRGSALMFVGFNLVIGFSSKQIDNSAHIGGLISGFLCGVVLAQPLGQPMRKLPALLAVAVTAGLAIAVLQLRPRPPDLQAELQAFSDVETRVLRGVRDLLTGEAGDLGAQDAAAVLERELLPAWQAAQDRLQRLHGLPERQQDLVDQLLRYAGARAAAWRQLVIALRTGDEDAARVAAELQKRADQLLSQFNEDAHP